MVGWDAFPREMEALASLPPLCPLNVALEAACVAGQVLYWLPGKQGCFFGFRDCAT